MPDQYGNPTEAELRGQAPPPSPFSMGGAGYSPQVAAAVAARNSGPSTQDIYGPNGQISHEERQQIIRDPSANATNFQSAFMDDPYLQRSDVAPFIQATNEDVKGKGKYGIRGWMHDHPVGVQAAFIAAAAGGAAAMNAYGGGAAGGAPSGGDLGIFSHGGEQGLTGVGGGNAGTLAAEHGISGGAGIGSATEAAAGSGAGSSLIKTLGKKALLQGVKMATAPKPGSSPKSSYTPNVGTGGPTVHIGGGGNYVMNPYATSAPMSMGSSPKTPPMMQPPMMSKGTPMGGPIMGSSPNPSPMVQNPMMDPRNRGFTPPGMRGIMPAPGAPPAPQPVMSPTSPQLAQANALRQMGRGMQIPRQISGAY